jgi:uncharacterized protein YlzI (FlbEa/FlbD family)
MKVIMKHYKTFVIINSQNIPTLDKGPDGVIDLIEGICF